MFIPVAFFFAVWPFVGSPDRGAAAEFSFDDLKLSVPDGFTVERAAGPPLVEFPVTVAGDEAGRLYVAEASGSNDPLERQQADPRHRVVRLEDTDGDGVFDRRTLFADRLMMLQGTLWHRGSLYVAAPPAIWKLTDRDDDGVADEREVWLDGGSLTKCGNDVHGPYLGRDGWFYWTKGGPGEQTHDLPGRPGWKTKAAHVFRARPDGSGREVVMTGGMDNPVDVAFTAEGERILSATFIEHPAGGLRDGLLHILYGGVYGRSSPHIRGHERTGDLLPALVHRGPAAISGLAVHSGHSFGPEYAGNLFACGFNLRSVTRHVLAAAEGSFTASDDAFLTGDSADFHPTDCVEDADGSLLVVDTGGWFKLCCPTSQLEKPAVRGGIYRIRRAAAAPDADPRGRAIDWRAASPATLVGLLGDERPVVVDRAIEGLADDLTDGQAGSEAAAIEPLRMLLADGAAAVAARQNAVWVLARSTAPTATALVRLALADESPRVRHAAAHVAGLHRDAGSVPPLAALLSGDDAGCTRAAAEALGRIGTAEAVEAVLAACPRAAGRPLEHSLTYALIEAARPGALEAALDSADPRVRRAAVYALDQMAPRLPSPPLTKDKVLAMCRDADSRVRDAAWWITAQHADWVDGLADEVRPLLERAATLPAEAAGRTVTLVAGLADQPAVADSVADALQAAEDPAIRGVALEVMKAAQVRAVPPSWVTAGAAALVSADAAGRAAVLEVLTGLPLSAAQRGALAPTLLALAADAASAPATCALAVQAAGPTPDLPEPLVERLIAMLEDDGEGAVSPLDRSAAAAALAAARLGDAALARVAETFARLRPHDVAVLLQPLAARGGPPLVRGVDALSRSARPAAVGRDLVASAVAALPPESAAAGAALLSRIDAERAAEREDFERLAKSLPPGDPSRGHRVFASAKAACTTCHAMAYVGGRVGPDLSKVGGIRTPRDLLEAIVMPSASFVRSYEPVTVVTEDGRAVSGIVRDETPTEIVVQTGAATAERIPRDEVESVEPGSVSLMPKGYDTLLTPQELADLVAFLARAK
jgi:putative membrane-bound dehydrogenase-like protein